MNALDLDAVKARYRAGSGDWVGDFSALIEEVERLRKVVDRVCSLAESSRSSLSIGCYTNDGTYYDGEPCEGRCGGHRAVAWSLDPAEVLAALGGAR